MATSTLRRTTLLLLITAVLTTSWASAAGPKAPRAAKAPAPATAGLLDRTLHFLVSLWADLGCEIDPDGRCTTRASQPVQPQTDTGCTIDPSGRCASRTHAETDLGCEIDPSGRCIH